MTRKEAAQAYRDRLAAIENNRKADKQDALFDRLNGTEVDLLALLREAEKEQN